MEPYLEKIISDKKEIKIEIEGKIREKTRLEVNLEIAEIDNVKLYCKECLDKNARETEELKKKICLDKDIFGLLINEDNLRLLEYSDMIGEVLEKYQDCNNCYYAHKDINGQNISPEENLFCFLHPDFDPKYDYHEILKCRKENFMPYDSSKTGYIQSIKKLKCIDKKVEEIKKGDAYKHEK